MKSFDRISLIHPEFLNGLVEVVPPSSAPTNNVPINLGNFPGNISVDVSGNVSGDVSGNIFGNIKSSSRLRSEKDISRNILGINIFGIILEKFAV